MIRFGVVLITEGCSKTEWTGKCRRAEDLGFDVVAVPDHLNLLAPFPCAVLAAEATIRPKIGTYVLNTSFYHPALLARDVATTRQLVGDRLELGLGSGYVRAEFEKAGIPFGTAASRADRLESVVKELDAALGDTMPPLMIGGHGDRILRLAAERAQTVSFTGAPYRAEYGRTALVDADALAERVAFVRAAAGGRALELNLLPKATVITRDRRAGLDGLRRYAPDLTTEQLLEVPTLLAGTPAQLAEQVLRDSERYGFAYYTVIEAAMEDFGRIIQRLR
ncbi:TIGR03621 family F420-dependent LLM class oxidoreductase [Nonomuraea typhae]|uniref:TIGR03621 family F420-dependent LLM class oxidoreductase n=1 Tax=Nonomuraea typhae TaxID=2603600 RepID=UPI0012F736C3|nr:TIGR03621 family F420-dependent LLM class oxidoreductase [Nonomuraea typhae]